MPEVRYRPKISRLLDEIMSGRMGRIAEISVAKISDATEVPRQTIYNWINADVDDPAAWFKRYDPEIEYRLREFFSAVLGRDTEVVERIALDSPLVQEMALHARAV